MLFLPSSFMLCSHLMSAFVSTATSHRQSSNAKNGSEAIVYVSVCIAIDTMLNFEGDANADVKCEQALSLMVRSKLFFKQCEEI